MSCAVPGARATGERIRTLALGLAAGSIPAGVVAAIYLGSDEGREAAETKLVHFETTPDGTVDRGELYRRYDFARKIGAGGFAHELSTRTVRPISPIIGEST